jgi:HMG (high mobility group) box
MLPIEHDCEQPGDIGGISDNGSHQLKKASEGLLFPLVSLAMNTSGGSISSSSSIVDVASCDSPTTLLSSLDHATHVANVLVENAKSMQEYMKDKPKRPLSAYNLFFRLERDRLLNSEGDTDPNEIQEITPEIVSKISVMRRYSDGKKRQHRKTHGKVGFNELTKIISEKWKKLPSATKELFEERAVVEKEKYMKENKQWKSSVKHKKIQPLPSLDGNGDGSGSDPLTGCLSQTAMRNGKKPIIQQRLNTPKNRTPSIQLACSSKFDLLNERNNGYPITNNMFYGEQISSYDGMNSSPNLVSDVSESSQVEHEMYHYGTPCEDNSNNMMMHQMPMQMPTAMSNFGGSDGYAIDESSDEDYSADCTLPGLMMQSSMLNTGMPQGMMMMGNHSSNNRNRFGHPKMFHRFGGLMNTSKMQGSGTRNNSRLFAPARRHSFAGSTNSPNGMSGGDFLNSSNRFNFANSMVSKSGRLNMSPSNMYEYVAQPTMNDALSDSNEAYLMTASMLGYSNANDNIGLMNTNENGGTIHDEPYGSTYGSPTGESGMVLPFDNGAFDNLMPCGLQPPHLGGHNIRSRTPPIKRKRRHSMFDEAENNIVGESISTYSPTTMFELASSRSNSSKTSSSGVSTNGNNASVKREIDTSKSSIRVSLDCSERSSKKPRQNRRPDLSNDLVSQSIFNEADL